MDQKDWVERRIDPQDRRRVRVYLTEMGRGLAETLVAEAKTHEAKLLSKLKDTDAARLKPALQALLENL